MKQLVDFTALQIKLASPESILSWSHGEVKKPETINYRSLKSEKDGLFDEKIFGPTKDYECYCGKYKRIRYKGIICDKCGVEVTQAKVRRERMGHLTLAAPVAHIWFFKGAPSKLSLLLDISPKNINSIVYFSQYIVLNIDEDQKNEVMEGLEERAKEDEEAMTREATESIETIKATWQEDKEKLKAKVSNKETLELKLTEIENKAKTSIAAIKQDLTNKLEQKAEIYKALKGLVKRLQKGSTISEEEYLKLDEYDAATNIEVGMGAESLLRLVSEINLDDLAEKLRQEMMESSGPKKVKAIKRLKVVEGFKKAGAEPTWMFMTVLPIIPPDLRPMVQLSGGKFATSDLNDLYRRVINRNNRLKHLIDLGAPEIILRNEKRMLQEAVDSLIDSTQIKKANTRVSRKPLKSLSEMLKGKQGRFRQNLLGKRVDYSGRSVIVVGPELKLNECGLPKDMALEIFKPYVLHELITQGLVPNVKSARRLVDSYEPIVFDILEKVTKNHPVILNRAPTLHKLGMQAFYPILIEGSAIRLHPCVCSGYNADFDGDQMAVHLPLTVEAQEECREMMLAENNLLKPANGDPITIPNKEMAMGMYYHTTVDDKLSPVKTVFANIDEAFHAYQAGIIKNRQLIKVNVGTNGKNQIVETTIGRIEFNTILPWDEFINEEINSKKIKDLVTLAISKYDKKVVAKLIDDIKDLGFKGATDSGLSVAVSDCHMIDNKDQIIDEANRKVGEIKDRYQNGMITDEERRKLIFQVWIDTTEEVANKTWDSYSEDNAVKVMINSGGTRASRDQVKQLAAMRGLVVDPMGNIVEMPTKSNFRQGLTIFEYVTSARGSRKGLTDSALKTADAGYLTRRLCDVAHDCIIRMEDCGTQDGIEIVRAHRPDSFRNRVVGRIINQDILVGSKVIAAKETMIDDEMADIIANEEKIKSIFIYSPISCKAPKGLCAKCYGWDFSSRAPVRIGVPVGILAAQSIGEPGTQLTMRVRHAGGILGIDVTQGLPRVEELLEIRKPKAQSVLAEIAGKVKIVREDNGIKLSITDQSNKSNVKEIELPANTPLAVDTGDLVAVAQQLTAGSVNLQELLHLRGLIQAQQYIIDQVQAVYESQGIPIHDKHFEVIVHKMGDKVQVENPGDTNFLTGEVIEQSKFMSENDGTIAAGGNPATAKVLLLGITRSSLFTSSWLSAASFQHTKNILTDAATAGSTDYLEGLKENVIIGRLIPTSADRAMIEE
ncbi:MAG: DNA-directed RNA polymerase subunit beta' [Pseudomonadales bacterium]|jgi:DNA-directed RNA polymerase subunit beta'|nr:DNA-directed RNA polymerase subunit beta' [Pseudomonadales bacterium]